MPVFQQFPPGFWIVTSRERSIVSQRFHQLHNFRVDLGFVQQRLTEVWHLILPVQHPIHIVKNAAAKAMNRTAYGGPLASMNACTNSHTRQVGNSHHYSLLFVFHQLLDGAFFRYSMMATFAIAFATWLASRTPCEFSSMAPRLL